MSDEMKPDALRPTFNHTRGDSPIAPCRVCARLMSRDGLLMAYLEAIDTDHPEQRPAMNDVTAGEIEAREENAEAERLAVAHAAARRAMVLLSRVGDQRSIPSEWRHWHAKAELRLALAALEPIRP